MWAHHVAPSVRESQHCDQSVLATRCRNWRYGETRLALHLAANMYVVRQISQQPSIYTANENLQNEWNQRTTS